MHKNLLIDPPLFILPLSFPSIHLPYIDSAELESARLLYAQLAKHSSPQDTNGFRYLAAFGRTRKPRTLEELAKQVLLRVRQFTAQDDTQQVQLLEEHLEHSTRCMGKAQHLADTTLDFCLEQDTPEKLGESIGGGLRKLLKRSRPARRSAPSALVFTDADRNLKAVIEGSLPEKGRLEQGYPVALVGLFSLKEHERPDECWARAWEETLFWLDDHLRIAAYREDLDWRLAATVFSVDYRPSDLMFFFYGTPYVESVEVLEQQTESSHEERSSSFRYNRAPSSAGGSSSSFF